MPNYTYIATVRGAGPPPAGSMSATITQHYLFACSDCAAVVAGPSLLPESSYGDGREAHERWHEAATAE